MSKQPASKKIEKQPDSKRKGLPGWRPGHSGNPAGRPPIGYAYSGILRAELELPIELDGEVVARKTAIARTLIAKALTGDTQALKLLYERIEGKPLETVNLEGSLQYTEAEQQESILLPLLKEDPQVWAIIRQKLRVLRLEGNGDGKLG